MSRLLTAVATLARRTRPSSSDALVMAGFVTHSMSHIEPSVIALLGAGAAIGVSRLPSHDYPHDVEWETLLFFAGLFIMVGSLVHQGVTVALSAPYLILRYFTLA